MEGRVRSGNLPAFCFLRNPRLLRIMREDREGFVVRLYEVNEKNEQRTKQRSSSIVFAAENTRKASETRRPDRAGCCFRHQCQSSIHAAIQAVLGSSAIARDVLSIKRR